MSVVTDSRRWEAQQWDSLLEHFDDANLLQTWHYGSAYWGESRLEHVVVRRSGPIGAAQAAVYRVPGLRRGLAYIKWGPVWQPSSASAAVQFGEIVAALREHYAKDQRMLLRITPWETQSDTMRRTLKDCGFAPAAALPPRRTAIVDLRHSLDALRASLTKHWRQNLKIAEKNNLEVLEGQSSALLDEFLGLYAEMRARKVGWIPSIAFFRTAYLNMPENHRPFILIGRSENTAVAGLIVSAMGKRAIAVFAATGNRGLALRGSYLLQWRTIERLHRHGVHTYDLGGINAKTHPGPTQFKLGLMGKLGWEADYIGDFQACESRCSQSLVWAGDRAHGAYKSLMKKWREHRQRAGKQASDHPSPGQPPPIAPQPEHATSHA